MKRTRWMLAIFIFLIMCVGCGSSISEKYQGVWMKEGNYNDYVDRYIIIQEHQNQKGYFAITHLGLPIGEEFTKDFNTRKQTPRIDYSLRLDGQALKPLSNVAGGGYLIIEKGESLYLEGLYDHKIYRKVKSNLEEIGNKK